MTYIQMCLLMCYCAPSVTYLLALSTAFADPELLAMSIALYRIYGGRNA